MPTVSAAARPSRTRRYVFLRLSPTLPSMLFTSSSRGSGRCARSSRSSRSPFLQKLFISKPLPPSSIAVPLLPGAGAETLRAGDGAEELGDLRAARIEPGGLDEGGELRLPASRGDEIEP